MSSSRVCVVVRTVLGSGGFCGRVTNVDANRTVYSASCEDSIGIILFSSARLFLEKEGGFSPLCFMWYQFMV